ncbi:DUF5808 domain-containing protein [Neobacillus sp.]|uniref:DUF1648 domain-containing protein n=1 Tax=Neobacillus sp. TaxID=2675273 RepID=UPI00289864A1|nr:DUF5808 domain-containing protein [Neobacillus sp.]
MNTANLIFLVAMMIPIFITVIFIPFWTRKTESFGVSIPEKAYHRPDIKKMRQKYAWTNVLLALITSAAFLLLAGGHDEDFIGILFAILIGIVLAASFAVYLVFHKQMKELKSKNQDWAQKPQLVMVDTGFRNKKLAHSNYWFVIPFLISIVAVVITLINYQQIPDRYPSHYNLSGEATDWTHKSYRSVLLMPIMQIYLTLVFLFINTIISKAKQQVSAENPEVSIRQNLIFRRRWSLFTIIMGTALVSMFLLIQLSIIYPINQQLLMIVPLVFTVGILAWTIILSITTGQGGSRIPVKTGSESGTIVNRDDDRYWKLGMFYFNKNDPAIFLEKRFGIGWTNNWAHPLSWIIILVILLVAVGLPMLLS